MTAARTYALPPEPPVGTVLQDGDSGNFTRRNREGATGWTWWEINQQRLPTLPGYLSWLAVLERGELIEVEPEAAAVEVTSLTGRAIRVVRDAEAGTFVVSAPGDWVALDARRARTLAEGILSLLDGTESAVPEREWVIGQELGEDDEPPIGSIIQDSAYYWTRNQGGWVFCSRDLNYARKARGGTYSHNSWADLKEAPFGSLRLVELPPAGDQS